MNTIIHDLTKEEFHKLHHMNYKTERVIDKNSPIKQCRGCFLCWVKTPGRCIMKDAYQKMGETLAASDEITIVSRMTYGGYSAFIKNILDRSISYILPYFTTRNGELHHKSRYKKQLNFHVVFYGSDISEEEKEVAKQLVKANAINFNCGTYDVTFVNSRTEIGRCLS